MNRRKKGFKFNSIFEPQSHDENKANPTTYPIQKVPSMKMYEQFQTIQENWGGYPDTDLTDFVYGLTSPGREPVATAVTIKQNMTGYFKFKHEFA